MSVVVGIVALFMFTGCDDGTGRGTGQSSEIKSGQSNYDRLAANQPAHEMPYSSTRATVNFFVDTWGQKGKLAYLYLMNNEGKVIGYYVTQGPPVSQCVSIRPTYRIEVPDVTGDNTVPVVVPGPSTDGVYYGQVDCNTYYAKDANTGSYIQFTAGMGINPLLYDQPLSPDIVKGAPNLGPKK